MAGTQKGGKAAALTNKTRHGSDFYARIGAKGGQMGHTGGFGAGEEGRKRAAIYGAIGGKISRRRKSKTVAAAKIVVNPTVVAVSDEA